MESENVNSVIQDLVERYRDIEGKEYNTRSSLWSCIGAAVMLKLPEVILCIPYI